MGKGHSALCRYKQEARVDPVLVPVNFAPV